MHRLVRWLGRRALRWFYRDVRIVGSERIPASGAVLLISNHPNDLPDVLIGFQLTNRPIRHVATAAAALSPAVNFVYKRLGVIPVARVRDVRALREKGIDIAAINEAALQKVSVALNRGDMVGLFPEGGVFRGPGIGPIRSGIGRMVLDSCPATDVWVVPVGLQYDAPERPGSDVTVVVGRAVSLNGWRASATSPPYASFTGKLREMLESVSCTARDGFTNRPQMLESAELVKAVGVISDAVERGGGLGTSDRDREIAVHAADGAAFAARDALFLLLTAPFALPSLLLHAPLFRAIWRSAVHMSAELGDRAARAIVPGLYLVFVWYAMLALALISTLRLARVPWSSTLAVTVPFVALLPRLGDLAMNWYLRFQGYLLHRAVRRLSKVDRDQISQSMATLREAWHLNQMVQK